MLNVGETVLFGPIIYLINRGQILDIIVQRKLFTFLGGFILWLEPAVSVMLGNNLRRDAGLI